MHALPSLTLITLCVFLFCGFISPKITAETPDLPPPRTPLEKYLLSLSEQFAIPILYNASHVKGLTIEQVRSDKSANHQQLVSILDHILSSTNLHYKIAPQGIIIFKIKPKTDASPVDPEVIVKGFRHSLLNARNNKFNSNIIQDSIVSEDIGKFPDHNLADSLQRVPGIAISREAGEGRQIALRGLGSDFTLVQLNGMNVLSNSDSPMDSRGQKTRNRAFDFNIFASELFSEINVKKAYLASEHEGGLAGIVELITPKPFDNPGFHSAFSIQASDNQYTSDIAPRVAGLISNTWDKFGALFSFAINRRDTEEQGTNTTRWRREGPNNADITGLSQDIQNKWNNNELYVPRGNRYSVWQSEQDRRGFTSALEYQSDRFSVVLDFVLSDFKSERKEHHLYPRGVNSTPVISGVTRVNHAEINEKNELIHADYSHAQMATESRFQQVKTEFRQLGANLSYHVTDKLTIDIQLGKATSDFQMPQSDKIYTEGTSGVTVSYQQDRYYGDYRYSADTTSTEQWLLHEIDLEKYFAQSEYDLASLDTTYNTSNKNTIKFGLSRKQLKNATARTFEDNLFRDEWENFSNGIAAGDTNESGIESFDARIPSGVSTTITDHVRADWIALDVNQTLAHLKSNHSDSFAFEGTTSFNIEDSDNGISEVTYSAYIENIHSAQLFKRKFETVLGLRYYRTNTFSEHLFKSNREEIDNHYSDILPSINVSHHLKDNFLIKANISKNITRPDLTALSAPIEVNNESSDSRIDVTISGANPKLKPYQSTNFDFSLEWYYPNEGYWAISYFNKRIKDYIITQSQEIPFAQTGLPQSFLSSGFSEQSTTLYISKTNSESAKVKGIELVYQKDFSFLPYPFNHLGTISHYTYADGDTTYYDNSGDQLFRKALPFLSKHTFSSTLYYETSDWGLRFSSTYRSSYISQIDTDVLDEENERGFHATQYLDASFYYYLSSQIKLTVEALNLSNQREEQYSDTADRAYNTTQSGRTFFLGINYMF